MRTLLLCIALAACGLLAGCLEATNAPLAPTARPAEWKLPKWKYAGSFGGHAELSVKSDDPWEQRFAGGQFHTLAGIDATDKEVWAADLGISRIQVFSHSGELLRTIGDGVPINGTLPTDIEFLEEDINFTGGSVRWEDTPTGQRWVNNRDGLFKAFDVAVRPHGYWISDQAQSSSMGNRQRNMAVRFYAKNGTTSVMQEEGGPLWPAWLAASDDCIATCELWGNSLVLAKLNELGLWETRRPAGGPAGATDFRTVMNVIYHQGDHPRQFFLMSLATRAGMSIGEFDYVGGMAIYRGKLISCDRRNRRLQIFEARPTEGTNWTQAIKMIAANKYEGGSRFRSPLAVCVSKDGMIYLLDGERREVAILSPTFERIGTLNEALLEAPLDIAISPDGRMLFISDQAKNLIHRYAVQ